MPSSGVVAVITWPAIRRGVQQHRPTYTLGEEGRRQQSKRTHSKGQRILQSHRECSLVEDFDRGAFFVAGR